MRGLQKQRYHFSFSPPRNKKPNEMKRILKQNKQKTLQTNKNKTKQKHLEWHPRTSMGSQEEVRENRIIKDVCFLEPPELFRTIAMNSKASLTISKKLIWKS